jgi:hypothetical protein
MAANIAIMAITTSGSISVKARADLGRSSAKRGGSLGESFKTDKLKINPHRCNRPLIERHERSPECHGQEEPRRRR